MNKQPNTPFTADATRLFSAPQDTVISMAFTRLLPILAAYTKAERDLEDINYSLDPAYGSWHREAEEAQDNLIDVLRLLRTTPATLAMDAPLRKIALLIHAMRDDPEAARVLHARIDADFQRQFRMPGLGATAQHRNALMNMCRPLLADLAELPIFDQVAVDDAEPGAPA